MGRSLNTRLILLLSLFIIAAVAPPATSNTLTGQDDTFLLGEGRFEIDGRKPKEFSEFRYLYLEGAVLKAAKGKRLLPQPPGTVRGELYGRQKLRLKPGRFEGEFLTFETQVVRGVSYRFEGKVSNYSDDDTGVIMPQFKGTLTKNLNGKKAASATVTFVWLEPEF